MKRMPAATAATMNKILSGCVIGVATFLAANPVLADDDEIIARLQRIEKALDGRGLVDLSQRVENLQQEVQELRGQLEEQNYALEQLRQSQRDTYLDLERRMAQGGGVPLAGAIGDPLGPVAGGDEPAGEPPLGILDSDNGRRYRGHAG